jgi:hypothetical protein
MKTKHRKKGAKRKFLWLLGQERSVYIRRSTNMEMETKVATCIIKWNGKLSFLLLAFLFGVLASQPSNYQPSNNFLYTMVSYSYFSLFI